MLYIIASENFIQRAERFDRVAKLEQGESVLWPEFSLDDNAKYGKPYDVAQKVLSELSSSVEYEIVDPSDSVFIGFAPLEEELCGWGRNHVSPHGKS